MRTIWGNWRLDTGSLELVHAADEYPIDLERMNGAAPMLDWIFQINEKPREVYPAQDHADLLQALRDILDPRPTWAVGVPANGSTPPPTSSSGTVAPLTRHRAPLPHRKSVNRRGNLTAAALA